MRPVPCKNATCTPSGADGFPDVKPLPFPLIPPEKVQLPPVGPYWNEPEPTTGVSNPALGTVMDTFELPVWSLPLIATHPVALVATVVAFGSSASTNRP